MNSHINPPNEFSEIIGVPQYAVLSAETPIRIKGY